MFRKTFVGSIVLCLLNLPIVVNASPCNQLTLEINSDINDKTTPLIHQHPLWLNLSWLKDKLGTGRQGTQANGLAYYEWHCPEGNGSFVHVEINSANKVVSVNGEYSSMAGSGLFSADTSAVTPGIIPQYKSTERTQIKTNIKTALKSDDTTASLSPEELKIHEKASKIEKLSARLAPLDTKSNAMGIIYKATHNQADFIVPNITKTYFNTQRLLVRDQSKMPTELKNKILAGPITLLTTVTSIIYVKNLAWQASQKPLTNNYKVNFYLVPKGSKKKELCYSFSFDPHTYREQTKNLTFANYLQSMKNFSFTPWCAAQMQKEKHQYARSIVKSAFFIFNSPV